MGTSFKVGVSVRFGSSKVSHAVIKWRGCVRHRSWTKGGLIRHPIVLQRSGEKVSDLTIKPGLCAKFGAEGLRNCWCIFRATK